MNTILQYLVDPIRDFIFPSVCFTCDRHLPEHRSRVCSSCWNSFTPVSPIHPAWIDLKAKFDSKNTVKDFLSCYLFQKEGKLQEVIHLLKYQGMKSLGVRLGEDIGKKIILNKSFANADYLIPVPLHNLKQRERGYNQSEFICKGISNITNMGINTSLIVRKKYTHSQTHLNLTERKENVGDAFEVRTKQNAEVSGKAFILVDDVITTGSTIIACAQELLKSGAGSVLAVSAAVDE